MRSPFDPEARALWAFRVLERGRHNVNLRRLTRAAWCAAYDWKRTGFQISRTFPMLAAVDGVRARGGFHVSTVRGSWLVRLRVRIALRVFLWWIEYLRRSLAKKHAGRPGWNDYYMHRWFITGDPGDALEIYSRAVQIPGPGADPEAFARAATARWMVSSVRGQHPDFDAAISKLEAHYGVPLVSLLPPAPDYRPQLPGVCSHCLCRSGAGFTHHAPACNCACHGIMAAAGAERVKGHENHD